MMLFKPEHIPLIIIGEKTESRRMWEKPRVLVGSFQQVKNKIYTKEHFGYIEILSVSKEHLLDITEEGAKREGNYSRERYIEVFHKIYPNVGENPEPFLISFRYIGKEKKVSRSTNLNDNPGRMT